MWRFTISPKIVDGEISGNSIGIVSTFSSPCHVALVPLRNR
jgi:hypothetical protein